MTDAFGQESHAQARCKFCSFGLIVTGEGEEVFLPQFFRSLMARAGCSFKVLNRIGQRAPITSEARKIAMVGSGKAIPTEDEAQIGLKARHFLRRQPCHFLILIDDLEHDRRPYIDQVFKRYRKALDTLLQPEEQRRASVHFFANMMEAYYFADSKNVNAALETTVLTNDSVDDVENLRHPKNELKQVHNSFDEKIDGLKIVPQLDLDHILKNPQTCAFLRSLIAWCVRQLTDHCPIHDQTLTTNYQISSGIRAGLTDNQ